MKIDEIIEELERKATGAPATAGELYDLALAVKELADAINHGLRTEDW